MESHSHSQNSAKHEAVGQDQTNLLTLLSTMLGEIFKQMQAQGSNGFSQLYLLTLVSKKTRDKVTEIITCDILQNDLEKFITSDV